jgi:Ca-activated chloride channel family protein
VILAGLSTLLGGEAHRRTEKGNALYLKGQAEPALSEYQKAQAAIPEAPQLHYDIGNVLYRQENWAGAAEAYEHALGVAGSDLSSRAAYNLGNALFHDEKYDDAVKAYTRALKGAPQDGDAKHNLELALRALEQKKQQQKQQNKPDQKQDQQDQQQQQSSSGSSKDDAKPKDDKSDNKSPESGPKEPGKQPQPKAGGMTPQEAEKLLDRLKDQEKQNVKNEQARRAKTDETPEKDW